jgi:hypothetical protein
LAIIILFARGSFRLRALAVRCGSAPLGSFYRFAFGLAALPQRIHGPDDLRWLPTLANVA